MIRHSLLLFVIITVFSVHADDSGIFFKANVSQGTMNGDKLYNFEGAQIGVLAGDSVVYIQNGKEGKKKNTYTPFSSYPVEFQYAVKYSFEIGYEKSFNRVLSLKGAIGYQQALMDAYAASIPGYFQGDNTEMPFVKSRIDRHWLSIPIDFKVTLPFRRSGIYLGVGPKASILLASTYTDDISNTSEDLAGLTPRFNFGLGIRLGAEFAIAKIGFLFIESGYVFGLLNTSPISSATTQEGEISFLGLGFRTNLP